MGGLKDIAVFIEESRISDFLSWQPHFSYLLNPAETQDLWHLDFREQELPTLKDPQGRQLRIDFDHNHLTYERKQLRGKNEPIAKALGLAKGKLRVHDLTVGLGADSITLGQLGFQMSGNERSPLLAFLLRRAFACTLRPELKSYSFIEASAQDILLDKNFLGDLDALYFDPMYPHKKKSALPKQEMVLFRELVGDDTDAGDVLAMALDSGVPRVVVKRPSEAGPLLAKPSYSIETKVVRFDVYQR